MRLKSTLAALMIVAAPVPALAHPHVFSEMWSDVIFDAEGRIVGIFVEWSFDENYTEIAIDGLDANGDGYYSDGELEVLTGEQIKALEEYHYFTYAKFDGKPITFNTVTDYDQILVGQHLKMSFRVPFKEPVDPKAGKFEYQIYDPDFYIAYDYAKKQPVNVIGEAPAGCDVKLHDLVADENTAKTKDFLATKPMDWKPDMAIDFGAMFAQTVSVDCAAARTD